MPSIELPSGRMRYELAGPHDAPVLVLSHSLGADLTMWEPQAAPFARRFRVLRYDTRGHGGSELASSSGTIAGHGQDVLGL
ncbi:MAG: alpha/beta fold hydrolase, partial [Chloroflexota bacterium]